MPTKTGSKEQESTAIKDRLEFPRKFKVVLLNDNKTTMDFVVEILTEIFHHSTEVAISIMLKVHNEGSAVCGIYPKEIALSKQEEVRILAQNAGYPLRVKIEEE